MITDLTQDECEKILKENHYAHLGYIENGEPSVLPITYLYRDGFLYGFTGKGHKLDIMRNSPNICIQVEQIESAAHWSSVLCWGEFEEITDQDTIEEMVLLFADQHGQILTREKTTSVSPLVKAALQERINQIKTGVLYRMKPNRMTGKGEKAAR